MTSPILYEYPVMDSKSLAPPMNWASIEAMRRGLLLPSLEGVDTVEQQISIAKRKAGIRDDEPVRLQRFEVVRHH